MEPADLDEPQRLFDGLARGNWHRPRGVTCLRLHRLEDAFFARLVSELQELVEAEIPSDPGKRVNWIWPVGEAMQFSLVNRSGDFDDPSSDNDPSVKGKRFHHGDRWPTIDAFVDAFAHSKNMRILGLNPSSALHPHEVQVAHRAPDRTWFRVRFHLPIITNAKAEIMLEGNYHHFKPGIVHFFNNGNIHSASNRGDTVRYHLVWDMRLTEDTFRLMFATKGPTPPFMKRITGAERLMTPLRSLPIGSYGTTGRGQRVYRKLRLAKLGIEPYVWQNLFSRYEYLRYRLRSDANFAPLD